MIQNFTRVAGALVESNGVNNDLQGHYSEPASLFSYVIYIFLHDDP
jgi:hypothetical protein